MRSGLFSMLLLSLATTAAAPQTNLDELIARAKSETWSVEEHDACYIVKDRSWPTRVALRITASREVANASRVLPLIPTRRFLISVQPLDPSTFEWLSATTWVY